MSVTVCLGADSLSYPEGGGHRWVYLNWALGLRSVGCRVIWLEPASPRTPSQQLRHWITSLTNQLAFYGLHDVALYSLSDEPLDPDAVVGCLDLAAAAEADLLLNLRYGIPADVLGRFRRTALLDIDPGLLQVWMIKGLINVPPHDMHFTIGETVGHTDGLVPTAGREWHYTSPCVSLHWWPPTAADNDAPFTTVAHWSAEEWVPDDDEGYWNDKRAGFLPYLDLPRHTPQPLELALCLATDEEEEREHLRQRGWSVQDAYRVASTPHDYQRYIQRSRGEFSCAKPSCVHLQNAWVSDRSLCYLASGKPVVVQHTGPSRLLPDCAGMCRFRTFDEAVNCLEIVADNYERHCTLARALAEEYFDAKRVAACVLERAMV